MYDLKDQFSFSFFMILNYNDELHKQSKVHKPLKIYF